MTQDVYSTLSQIALLIVIAQIASFLVVGVFTFTRVIREGVFAVKMVPFRNDRIRKDERNDITNNDIHNLSPDSKGKPSDESKYAPKNKAAIAAI